MTTSTNKNIRLFSLSFFLSAILAISGLSQTTAFTYQGFVKDGATAANGIYDFEFRIFSSVSGGAQAGSTLTRNAVVVTNGIFAVELDFGAPPFPGADRFLEIRVRTAGGGSFTTLNPRTKVGTAPYSTLAATAANSSQLGGQAASAYILSGAASINANLQFNIGGDRMLFAPGINNTFVGRNAGATASISTVDNTAFGASAGSSITLNTSNNSFFGSQAGRESQGGFNSFFGSGAGRDNVSGTSNSFFGALSGFLNTASNNSFFGYQSGRSNIVGTQNSFFGFNSGLTNDGGIENSFFGYESGKMTNSSFNTFVGSRAGQANTSGGSNSFFGTAAGLANTTGADNSFFGVNTGISNAAGNSNSYFGRRAGRDNTDGFNNSAFGMDALRTNQGPNNTAIGVNAGFNNQNGNNNTFVGANTDIGDSITTTLSFATAIGAGAKVSSSNSVVIGRGNDDVLIPGELSVGDVFKTGSLFIISMPDVEDNSVCFNNVDELPAGSASRIGRCSSSIQYKEDIGAVANGTSLVKLLRPVSFTWKRSGKRTFGLIAEEVNEVEPLLAARNNDGSAFGVNFNAITAVLIKSVQEQQIQIETLSKRNFEKSAEILRLRDDVLALRQLVCSIRRTSPICKKK